MKRALVLNAGPAWAAYQIGALRHLVVDRAMRFDLHAGTGIGAMNAAFVACGEFAALEAFWQRIGLRRLLTFNWRRPWREGPFSGAPQRRFIAAHVSTTQLEARGATLLISTLNLQTGREQVLEYPGSDLPLEDGLMAAVATPGLCPPVCYRGQQLVEGTVINSILLHTVLQYPLADIVVIAAALQQGRGPLRRYGTWRAVLERALALNQARDVWDGLAEAQQTAAAAAAFRHVSEQVPRRLADHVSDPAVREELRRRLEEIYARSAFPLRRPVGPALRAITPSRDLSFPLWRFRPRELSMAQTLGYADARRVMEAEVPQ